MQPRSCGIFGLFLKICDAPIIVRLHHAKSLRHFLGINLKGSYGGIRSRIYVVLQHFLVVHFVDVIAGKNHDVAGTLVANGINVLINGICGAKVPGGGDAHLRRQHFDVFAEAEQRSPSAANVAIQTERLVLSENKHAAQIAIDAI